MMKTNKFNKTNVARALIEIQDEGDVRANSLATAAIQKLGLKKVVEKETKKTAEIFVVVNGGVVQSILSTTYNIKVHLIDHDNDEDPESKQENDRLVNKCKDLPAIF